MDTLFQKYVDNCSNNDIPIVSPNSFKQTVSKLWDINSTSTTSGGERVYVYKGLKYVENPQNTPIIEEHLPSGWFVIAKDHSGVRVAIKCDVSVNGTPLLKEVHMDSVKYVIVKRKMIKMRVYSMADRHTSALYLVQHKVGT